MKTLTKLFGPVALATGFLLATLCIPEAAAKDQEADTPQSPVSLEGRIETQADRILRQMGEYLASAQEFRFRADITYDRVRNSGQKILLGGRAEASLQRPNRLHAYYEGDRRHSHAIWADGSFTYYDVARNLYARMEVPAELDLALDAAFDVVGFSAPVADLFYADPYRTLIENARSGYVVGNHPVAGTPCHHLAFTNEAIDWQIWIEDGPRPVPRRLIITYKNDFKAPQYVVNFPEWDFQPRVSSAYFEFNPPAESAEMEFLSQQMETNQ